MPLGPFNITFAVGMFFFLMGLFQVFMPQLSGLRTIDVIDEEFDAPRDSAGPAEQFAARVVGALLILIGVFFLLIWAGATYA